MNTNLKSFNTAFDTGAAVAILVGILATASAIVGESMAREQILDAFEARGGLRIPPGGSACLPGSSRLNPAAARQKLRCKVWICPLRFLQ